MSIPSSINPPSRPSPGPWLPCRGPNSLDHFVVGPGDLVLGERVRELAPPLDPVFSPSVGYDRTNKQHHSLLLCLLMTSCDLSDQTKGWKTTRKIAVRATPSQEGAACKHCPALCGSCPLNTLSVLSSAWLYLGETET